MRDDTLPNANLIVLVHFLFKVLPLPICALSIYLGYRLFILGVSGEASLSIDTGKVSGQLLNAAPGIFFMLGGVVATVASIYRGMDVLYRPHHTVRLDDIGGPSRYKGLMNVKFQRTDRLPGGPHDYGESFDAILDNLTGGSAMLNRSALRPSAVIVDTSAVLSLHEDGPEVEMTAHDVQAFLDRSSTLLQKWCGWTPPANAPDKRDVRVTVASHTYVGKPSKTELRRILTIYGELAAAELGEPTK